MQNIVFPHGADVLLIRLVWENSELFREDLAKHNAPSTRRSTNWGRRFSHSLSRAYPEDISIAAA